MLSAAGVEERRARPREHQRNASAAFNAANAAAAAASPPKQAPPPPLPKRKLSVGDMKLALSVVPNVQLEAIREKAELVALFRKYFPDKEGGSSPSEAGKDAASPPSKPSPPPPLPRRASTAVGRPPPPPPPRRGRGKSTPGEAGGGGGRTFVEFQRQKKLARARALAERWKG